MQLLINTNLHTILSKYISYDKRGNKTGKQLQPEESLQFYQEIKIIAETFYNSLNISKNEFTTVLNGVWLNHYNMNDFNEVHNYEHTDTTYYTQKWEYTGIIILDAGADEHLIIYDETNTIPTVKKIQSGDCYIISNNIMHGLELVKDRVTAIMFMIKE